jgi:hypothetical protein
MSSAGVALLPWLQGKIMLIGRYSGNYSMDQVLDSHKYMLILLQALGGRASLLLLRLSSGSLSPRLLLRWASTNSRVKSCRELLIMRASGGKAVIMGIKILSQLLLI